MLIPVKEGPNWVLYYQFVSGPHVGRRARLAVGECDYIAQKMKFYREMDTETGGLVAFAASQL